MDLARGSVHGGGANCAGLTSLHLELVVNRPGQTGSVNYRLLRLSREVCREWRTTVDGKPFYAASSAFLSHLGSIWLRHFCASESVSRYISMARVIGAGVHPQAENAILAIDQKTRIQHFRSDLRRLSEVISRSPRPSCPRCAPAAHLESLLWRGSQAPMRAIHFSETLILLRPTLKQNTKHCRGRLSASPSAFAHHL